MERYRDSKIWFCGKNLITFSYIWFFSLHFSSYLHVKYVEIYWLCWDKLNSKCYWEYLKLCWWWVGCLTNRYQHSTLLKKICHQNCDVKRNENIKKEKGKWVESHLEYTCKSSNLNSRSIQYTSYHVSCLVDVKPYLHVFRLFRMFCVWSQIYRQRPVTEGGGAHTGSKGGQPFNSGACNQTILVLFNPTTL